MVLIFNINVITQYIIWQFAFLNKDIKKSFYVYRILILFKACIVFRSVPHLLLMVHTQTW